MDLNLNDLYRLIEKEAEKHEKIIDRLFQLVEKNVVALERVNVANDDLKRVLGGIKRTSWLDFVTKLFSYVIVILFLLIVAFAIKNDTPFKYGDLEVNMPAE
jgi:hypothetical protein